MSKYTKINDAMSAKVTGGKLFVKITSRVHGCLESGGAAGRVKSIDFSGTLADALKPYNDYGITSIDKCLEQGILINKGRRIY